MEIFGLILLGIGGGLGWGHLKQKQRVKALISADQATVSLVQSVAQDMGSLVYRAGLRGVVVCDQPITSELAQEPCVYYSMTVTRQYEETRWRTNSKGEREQETVRGSSTEASNQRSIPFWLEDNTGRIRVLPDGAEFMAETLLSRFEPEAMMGGMSLRVGGFTLRVGAGSGGRRTLGYQFEEKGIPVGRSVFILGEVTNPDGELQIHRPTQGRFVISSKPVEELIRGGQVMANGLLAGSVVTSVAGVVLLVLAVL
ncbi:MAG: hypothetical protein OHK0012_13790 [Synechococcales cyanobacterium]